MFHSRPPQEVQKELEEQCYSLERFNFIPTFLGDPRSPCEMDFFSAGMLHGMQNKDAQNCLIMSSLSHQMILHEMVEQKIKSSWIYVVCSPQGLNFMRFLDGKYSLQLCYSGAIWMMACEVKFFENGKKHFGEIIWNHDLLDEFNLQQPSSLPEVSKTLRVMGIGVDENILWFFKDSYSMVVHGMNEQQQVARTNHAHVFMGTSPAGEQWRKYYKKKLDTTRIQAYYDRVVAYVFEGKEFEESALQRVVKNTQTKYRDYYQNECKSSLFHGPAGQKAALKLSEENVIEHLKEKRELKDHSLHTFLLHELSSTFGIFSPVPAKPKRAEFKQDVIEKLETDMVLQKSLHKP